MALESPTRQYATLGTPQAEATQRTIGQLVADVTSDVQGILRSEVALAKAEVQHNAKVMGKGAALVGAAAFLGLLGLIFLFHTMAEVIAIWLPLWAGYFITTAFLLLVAAILGLVGSKILKATKPAPERAIAEAKATITAIRPEATRHS